MALLNNNEKAVFTMQLMDAVHKVTADVYKFSKIEKMKRHPRDLTKREVVEQTIDEVVTKNGIKIDGKDTLGTRVCLYTYINDCGIMTELLELLRKDTISGLYTVTIRGREVTKESHEGRETETLPLTSEDILIYMQKFAFENNKRLDNQVPVCDFFLDDIRITLDMRIIPCARFSKYLDTKFSPNTTVRQLIEILLLTEVISPTGITLRLEDIIDAETQKNLALQFEEKLSEDKLD